MYNVFTLEGALFPPFRPLLPGNLIPHRQTLFGCMNEQQTPCGAAVVDHFGDRRTLSWLYVAEDVRGQGCGSALLDHVCTAACSEPGTAMDAVWRSDMPWSLILEGMVARRGGQLRLHTLPCFRISNEALRASPLMAGLESDSLHSPNMIPLNDLTSYQLKELRVSCEQRGLFNVSRADFSQADPRYSMVALHQQHAEGLTLVREIDHSGKLSLDLLYLSPGHSALGLPLLRQTAAAILTDPRPMSELQMVCVNETTVALGNKLLGEQHRSSLDLLSGTFLRELYVLAGR